MQLISSNKDKFKLLILNIILFFHILQLVACTPLIVGGAAVTTTIMVASDRRTTGTQLEDGNIRLKAEKRILQESDGHVKRIVATSYNRRLLLTGDVENKKTKQLATKIAHSIENVVAVNNQMKIRSKTPIATRSNETWITSKVKSAFLSTNGVPSGTISVTTDHDTVFLMGLVTPNEGEKAASIAANINGVNYVFKCFEYISQDEADRLSSYNFSKLHYSR